MERILITGGSGLLGSVIAFESSKQYSTLAIYNNNRIEISGVDTCKLDVGDREKVKEVVDSFQPDAIIHAAAITDSGFCENNRDLTWKVNVEGAKNIAECCEEASSKMVYISTNYVFDGRVGRYKERDIPNPVNYYGKTKFEAENIVKKTCGDYIIARVTPYGWDPKKKQWAAQVVARLERGEKITAYQNQYYSPMLANNCADVLLSLYQMNEQGIFHVAGTKRVSRSGFATTLAEVFDLDKKLIEAVDFEKNTSKTRRPKDTSLDVSKVTERVKIKILGLREGIMKMKKLREDGYLNIYRYD